MNIIHMYYENQIKYICLIFNYAIFQVIKNLIYCCQKNVHSIIYVYFIFIMICLLHLLSICGLHCNFHIRSVSSMIYQRAIRIVISTTCVLHDLLTCDLNYDLPPSSFIDLWSSLQFTHTIWLLHRLSNCERHCDFHIWSTSFIVYRLVIFIVISVYELSPLSFIDLWFSL